MSDTSYAGLNALLEQARRPSSTPLQVTDDQLLALQRRWSAALSARLDAVLEYAGDTPLTDAVARAWRHLAAENDTLRRLLDAHEANSLVLARGQYPELRMLALAAGLSDLDDPHEEAVRIGHAYRATIRKGQAASTGRFVKSEPGTLAQGA